MKYELVGWLCIDLLMVWTWVWNLASAKIISLLHLEKEELGWGRAKHCMVV